MSVFVISLDNIFKTIDLLLNLYLYSAYLKTTEKNVQQFFNPLILSTITRQSLEGKERERDGNTNMIFKSTDLPLNLSLYTPYISAQIALGRPTGLQTPNVYHTILSRRHDDDDYDDGDHNNTRTTKVDHLLNVKSNFFYNMAGLQSFISYG